MKTILFEDREFVNLLPLVYFRPVWELRCGIQTLEEKVQGLLGEKCHYLAREYLQQCYLDNDYVCTNSREAENALFINGRWVIDEEDLPLLANLSPQQALLDDGQLLAFKTSWGAVKTFLSEEGVLDAGRAGRDLAAVDYAQKRSESARLLRYPWNAINWNGAEIKKDYRRLAQAEKIAGQLAEGVHIEKPHQVTIEKSAVVKPGVVIDAGQGPVWIDEGAKVMANAVLEGPLYLGKGATVKIGAKIYENTTIGPVCKVGEKVEESIIHGYSNKQHDGFLGHAYLGEWVNIGADTNNSDLKNNYGLIRVFVNGSPVDTGERFVGLVMGDHSKSAINTMFNTGTIVGVNCNVFGSGMPPKFIPSFSWGGADNLVPYDFERAIEVAKTVMVRRDVYFSADDKAMFVAIRDLAKRAEKGSRL